MLPPKSSSVGSETPRVEQTAGLCTLLPPFETVWTFFSGERKIGGTTVLDLDEANGVEYAIGGSNTR